MPTLEFQDGCLPWNSKMDAYPGIPRWMPTLEFQDRCLPQNSKMDAYLGIPRQMATLEFQDGCLPWNSKINAYPGIPRWMPTLEFQDECLPDNFKMTNQPHLVLLSYVQLIGLDFLVYAFTKPGHTSISELLGSTWKYLSQKKNLSMIVCEYLKM